mmetsp:Transcript_74632/g.205774  ORF Transcript_74632/g.205774 Transcript_74632/m.205774 type:complete len:281 (-) Transcript_74632:1-843(-)
MGHPSGMRWAWSVILATRFLGLAEYSLKELAGADHSIGMKLAVEEEGPELLKALVREYLAVQRVDPADLWTARTNIYQYADFPIVHYACLLSDREKHLQVLLEAGAPPDAEADTGMRPLHVAAEHGSAGAVRALLEAGVDARGPVFERTVHNNDARQTGYNGMTAATLAARGGHLEALRALLDAGGAAAASLADRDVNPEVPDGGWAPIQYAAKSGKWALIDFLTFEVGWGDIGAADVLRAARLEDRAVLELLSRPLSQEFQAQRERYLRDKAKKSSNEL